MSVNKLNEKEIITLINKQEGEEELFIEDNSDYIILKEDKNNLFRIVEEQEGALFKFEYNNHEYLISGTIKEVRKYTYDNLEDMENENSNDYNGGEVEIKSINLNSIRSLKQEQENIKLLV